MIWQTRRKNIHVARGGILMGILNITPDSFSDGGLYNTPAAAVGHALSMLQHGAEIIDIGGESTRPGSLPVTPEEEIARVIPVIKTLRRQTDALLSLDTRNPQTARRALDQGIDIINDIEALTAPGMAELCAEYGCGIVAMHMQGSPATMQQHPEYRDVIMEVRGFFQSRYQDILAKGVKPEQICWDPGIGFGKTLEHNLTLIAHLSELRVADRPLLLALSRKRFFTQILDDQTLARSPLSTATLTTYGHKAGAQLHRVHDVAECAQALKLIQAIEPYER